MAVPRSPEVTCGLVAWRAEYNRVVADAHPGRQAPVTGGRSGRPEQKEQ
jgi:hypothetical protein